MGVKPEHDKTVELPDEEALDAGLAAAFGPRSSPPGVGVSVLDSLGRGAASMPRVLLRESAEDGDPVIKTRSAEISNSDTHHGRYQLFGEIAQGGMGAILRGRDTDLGRELAVKVLLSKHKDKPEVIQRFVEEAQIGGQLQHPGIAPVYELGQFADRRPFFAMKLVKGKTLASLLEGRRKRGEDRAKLIGIFEQICQTMAYAHSRGVIHRDLKPANIMVGAFGEVQVMDWGLAKVLAEGGVADEKKAEKTRAAVSVIRTVRSEGSTDTPGAGSQTHLGSVLGTPAYMAPEQARGDVELVDERADVFGLGAILCAVLTGEPPYTGSGAEAMRKAQTARLDDALARLDACDADAELVDLSKRCLAVEPWDRPRHAGDMADELSGYLAAAEERLRKAELDRVEAEARTVEERKRRKVTLALAASILLTVSVVAGGWTWMAQQQADHQRQIAAAEREKNDRLQKKADQKAQLNQQINDALAEAERHRVQAEIVTRDNLVPLEKAVAAARRAEALLNTGPADERFKPRIERLLEELQQQQKDARLLAAVKRAHLARTCDLQGESGIAGEERKHRLYDNEKMVALYQKALEEDGMEIGKGSPQQAAAKIQQRSAAVQAAIIAALEAWHNAKKHKWRRIGIDFYKRRNGKHTISRIVPDSLAARDGRLKPGDVLLGVGQGEDGEIVDVRGLSPREVAKLIRGDLETPVTRLKVKPVDQEDSQVYVFRRSPTLAWLLAVVQAADTDPWRIKVRTAYREKDPPARKQQLLELARQVDFRSQPSSNLLTLVYRLKSEDLIEDAVALMERAVEEYPDDFELHYHLALDLGISVTPSRPEQARSHGMAALAINPNVPQAHNNLAVLFGRTGDHDRAERSVRRAVELSPEVALYRRNLAVTLAELGKHEEAAAEWRKAVELNPASARSHQGLGDVLKSTGQIDEAIAEFRTAVELEPDDRWHGIHLANALIRHKQTKEGFSIYEKLVEQHPQNVGVHFNLGGAFYYVGEWEKSIAASRRAIELAPHALAPHRKLAAALRKAGRKAEVAPLYRKFVRHSPSNALAHRELGRALKAAGQLDEAIVELRRAVQLDPDDRWHSFYLANALIENKQTEEGISIYEVLAEQYPARMEVHFNLGAALGEAKEWEKSIAASRRAIELAPKQQGPYGNLARALLKQKNFAEAIPALQTAIELQPGNPRLHALLRTATTDAELYRSSADYYRKLFAKHPQVAQDLVWRHRFYAARFATLAAQGKGDGESLGKDQRQKLRQQAVQWLRGDLDFLTKTLDSGAPESRTEIESRLAGWLRGWQRNAALAGIRDAEQIAKLPEEERRTIEQLWADVEALLKRAEKLPAEDFPPEGGA